MRVHVHVCVCVCVVACGHVCMHVCVCVDRYLDIYICSATNFMQVFRYMFSNKFWSATVIILRLMSQGLLCTHDIFCVLDLLHFKPIGVAS